MPSMLHTKLNSGQGVSPPSRSTTTSYIELAISTYEISLESSSTEEALLKELIEDVRTLFHNTPKNKRAKFLIQCRENIALASAVPVTAYKSSFQSSIFPQAANQNLKRKASNEPFTKTKRNNLNRRFTDETHCNNLGPPGRVSLASGFS